jgi:uncharacterized damage-inducible protein DinB
MKSHRISRFLLLAALAAPASAAAQDNPFSYHSRWMYAGVKYLLVASAEKMPEENYSFRPTEAVRSFGEIIGHLADWQYRYCSIARGEKSPLTSSIEMTKTSKADLVAAIKAAVAYCDGAYDTMTDAAGARMIKLGTHEMPVLGMLNTNNIHSTEHYGNLVTYLRLKNIVPPSSEPGFNVLPPKK